MYKCGWNGCEKAYGTLNHLNAHVTMQSHGQKRTPEGIFPLAPALPAHATEQTTLRNENGRTNGRTYVTYVVTNVRHGDSTTN